MASPRAEGGCLACQGAKGGKEMGDRGQGWGGSYQPSRGCTEASAHSGDVSLSCPQTPLLRKPACPPQKLPRRLSGRILPGLLQIPGAPGVFGLVASSPCSLCLHCHMPFTMSLSVLSSSCRDNSHWI